MIRVRKYVVHYTFQHMSTITKLSQDVIQYYKNITSLIGANARIQRDIQLWTIQRALLSYKRKTRGTNRGPEMMGLQTVYRWSTLSLPISDQQPGESTSSKLRDLDMKIPGSQKLHNEWVVNAKWRAGISTLVLINLIQKHALKTISWAYTPKHEGGSNRWDVHMWQNQLYGLSR